MAEHAAPDPPRLRRNVCAVLVNPDRTQVLVFRRTDGVLGKHRWQFPQGGMDADETPDEALLRELREEIGTDAVDVLARLPEPIAYLFPPEIRARLRASDPGKAAYDGQAQSWYLLHLREGEESLNFGHQPPEFDAYAWVTPREAVERVVPFKQEAYRQALTAFGLLPPPGG